MLKRFIILFVCVTFCCFQANAGWFPLAASSGNPTWTATTSGVNAACGFVTTCTITGLTVSSGFNVVVLGGTNQSGATSTVSSVTLCGTSLTLVQAPSAAGGNALGALFAGTVTGGTCSLAATASAAGAWQTMSGALGLLSNLSSTTATGSCNSIFIGSQASPYECASTLTIAAGGFAIGGLAVTTNSAVGTDTLIFDANSPATASAAGIGHSSVAGSINAGLGDGNFQNVVVMAGTWR